MMRVRSARLADLPGVAVVLEDSFNDKMRVIFGKQPEKTRLLLETIYTGPVRRGYDGVMVAEQDGRIVGTLLSEPMHHTTQENRTFVNIATRELGQIETVVENRPQHAVCETIVIFVIVLLR